MNEPDQNLQAALLARQEDCWDRFSDAVTELLELHLVTLDEIIAEARHLKALASTAERLQRPSRDRAHTKP
jgi:hypothetical protein